VTWGGPHHLHKLLRLLHLRAGTQPGAAQEAPTDRATLSQQQETEQQLAAAAHRLHHVPHVAQSRKRVAAAASLRGCAHLARQTQQKHC